VPADRTDQEKQHRTHPPLARHCKACTHGRACRGQAHGRRRSTGRTDRTDGGSTSRCRIKSGSADGILKASGFSPHPHRCKTACLRRQGGTQLPLVVGIRYLGPLVESCQPGALECSYRPTQGPDKQSQAMQNHSGSSVLSNLFLLSALARILGTHGCRRAQPYVTDVPQLAETKKTAARKTDPCKVSVCQPLSCKC
jgi:hypothetical protein